MIGGGHATIYVSNMDDSIRFYTEVLGLTLRNRFGNYWAAVQAGTTLVIGLHPSAEKHPPPGTRGAVQIGFVVSPDETVEALAARLRQHGVTVSDILPSDNAHYILVADPDGNELYVGDWGVRRARAPQDAVSSTAP